jgi:hypothetical protein
MREMRNAHIILSENLKGTDYLEYIDMDINRRIILEWFSNRV